jgi:4-amino-4-deoxychorismate lyase
MNNILVNGSEQSSVDVRDRGFQYGDGIFETIAYKNGQLQLWDEHMQRMQQSAERLSIPMADKSLWLEDIKKLNLSDDAIIKLTLTRGVSGRGYAYGINGVTSRISAVYSWPEYAESNSLGVTACICETPVSVNSALAGIKHLNRLDNVLARNEWSDIHITEGFMLDHNRHVIEGTMSNVFCVLDDELYTPSQEGSGVAGVMRQHVMKLAEQNNISVNVIDISEQNFLHMDSVFITNSLIGIWPVTKILAEDQQYNFSIAEQAKILQACLSDSLNT